MDLELGLREGLFRDIELVRVGSHSVQAVVHGRTFRITAAESLTAESPSFDAQYEELVFVESIGADFQVWANPAADIEIPWASGDSIGMCLRSGLSSVANAIPEYDCN